MAAEELAEWNDRRERSARLIQHVWRRWKTSAGSEAQSFQNSPLARSRATTEEHAYASDVDTNGSSQSREETGQPKLSTQRKQELTTLVDQRMSAWKAKTLIDHVQMNKVDENYQEALEHVVGVRSNVRAMKRVLRESELESQRLEQPIELSSKFQDSTSEVKLPKPGSRRLMKAMESHAWCLVEHGMYENGWELIKECCQGRH